MGVWRGSLDRAYGGKEEIFLRVFGDYRGRFLNGAASALWQPTRRAALSALFGFCVTAITSGEPSRGCLSTRTAVDAGREAPRVPAEVREFLARPERVVLNGLAAVPDDAPLAVGPAAAALAR